MTQIDPAKPLAWLGDDRLLVDDRTPYGLRRRVIARKGELMNTVFYVQQVYALAGDAPLGYWMFEQDGFWYLWIVWKDKRK